MSRERVQREFPGYGKIMRPDDASTTDLRQRQLYSFIAWLSIFIYIFIALYDSITKPGSPIFSTIAGVVVSAAGLLFIHNPRISLRSIEVSLAIIVFFGALSEISNVLRNNNIGPRQIMTFILLISVWFGVLPIRQATLWVALAYVGFIFTNIAQPYHDLGTLAYLAVIITMIGAMSHSGRQVNVEREERAVYLQQALTDPLTALPNRRAMMIELEIQWEARQSSHTFTLFMLDIDHFKRINDDYGHTIGDEVLQRIGERLPQLLAEQPGQVARWGGEEFMLLCQCSPAEAHTLASTLSGQRFDLGPGLPTVTFSVGAALAQEASSLRQLLSLVDERLHAAKQSGRNQVKWDKQLGQGIGPA